jgi:hypothetical protein
MYELYKRIEEPQRVCLTNDRLSYGLTIVMYNEHLSYTLSIRGEAFENIWADIKYYSVDEETFKKNIDVLEQKLIDMWLSQGEL